MSEMHPEELYSPAKLKAVKELLEYVRWSKSEKGNTLPPNFHCALYHAISKGRLIEQMKFFNGFAEYVEAYDEYNSSINPFDVFVRHGLIKSLAPQNT